MKVEQRTEQVYAAAMSAIATLGCVYPEMTMGDLISGLMSILITTPTLVQADIDREMRKIMFFAVQAVGEERAHELVDVVVKAGAKKR